MNLKATIFGALASAALLFASDAHAKVLELTFTSADGDGSVRILTVQRSNEHLAISATGIIDGNAASLIAPGGFASNDNLIFLPNSPAIDFSGLSFLAGRESYNLYFDNGTVVGTGYAICTVCTYSGGNSTLLTSFSLTAVPEPSTWAMLFVGLLGVGAIVRRRGKAPLAGYR